MPQDNQDDKPATQPTLGRTYRDEGSAPIRTPSMVSAVQAKRAEYERKPNAVGIQVYFVARGINNPIEQASMLAYTDIRTAPVEDFDEIFTKHNGVPEPKLSEETKRP